MIDLHFKIRRKDLKRLIAVVDNHLDSLYSDLTKNQEAIKFFEPFRSQLHWETVCPACGGSGRYDHNGDPPCGACEGTGRREK